VKRDRAMCDIAEVLGAAAPSADGDFAGELGKEDIASFAGCFEVFGAERAANPFLGKGGGMRRVVQEPSAVVIPQVMVWVVGAEPQAWEWRVRYGRGHNA